MVVSVTIAGVVGIVGAWAATNLQSGNRLEKSLSRAFAIAMLVAIAIPMIMHAAAWEATAGKFGWMIMTQTGSRTDSAGVFGFFTGLVACGWIHGMVGAAIVAMATWFGTQRTPDELLQQSQLEIGPIATWWRVRLPIAAPWVVTALLATAMLAATEMTVVDLYGYRTVVDQFYLFYATNPTTGQILMTCFLPLAFATSILTWLFVSRRRLNAVQDAPPSQSPTPERPPVLWRCFSVVLVLAAIAMVALVPVLGLLAKIGHEVAVIDGQIQASWSAVACLERLATAPATFRDEYFWTALIAGTTGCVAALFAWPLAARARTKPKLERVLDVITIVAVTLPGPIVGLAVVTFFQQPLPGFKSLYHASIFPTVLALLVRALPVSYWLLRASYRGIHTATLEAASMEVSWSRRLWKMDFPLLWRQIVIAGLASAVVASGDVPVTLPIIPAGLDTVGTRLFQLLHSGARYQEAALAIWYVVGVVAVALACIRQSKSR